MSYRDTALYRRLMRRPASWREAIRLGFRGIRYVTGGVHDIPALRAQYLFEIRYRVYLLFYVDCNPLLPVDEFLRLLRRYCRLSEDEFDIFRQEYIEAYNPPIDRNAVGPRTLFDQACRVIHIQYDYNDTLMSRLPLGPLEMAMLLWRPNLH